MLFFELIIFSLWFEISTWILNFARIIIYEKHELKTKGEWIDSG